MISARRTLFGQEKGLRGREGKGRSDSVSGRGGKHRRKGVSM
jgi:hypothetical protein